jgi:hypothetical protein
MGYLFQYSIRYKEIQCSFVFIDGTACKKLNCLIEPVAMKHLNQKQGTVKAVPCSRFTKRKLSASTAVITSTTAPVISTTTGAIPARASTAAAGFVLFASFFCAPAFEHGLA